MYDGELRLQLSKGATVTGNADDIAVVMVAEHKKEVTEIADEEIIHTCLQQTGLEIPGNKLH